MRLVHILTAVLVAAGLYYLVFQRGELLSFARGGAPIEEVATAPDDNAAALADAGVPVVAMQSQARRIDSAVLVRGRTEAARQVDVQAETSGKIVSQPLRSGAFVEAGQLLCSLDPGTREATRNEALARLAEARSRLPEAQARLAEAEAGLPAAQAKILEAGARIPEAQARQAEARASVTTATARLAEARTGVPTAQARLAEALANVPAAQARLGEAEAGVPTARARLVEAQASVPTAQARLVEAEANVPAAEARLLEAEASVPAARARLEEARARQPESEARLTEAQARVDEAQINLNAARKLAEGGFAADTRVAAAVAAWESTQAGVQSALLLVQTAKSGVENANSQVQGAIAAVATARGQVESARAAVQSARGQVESARAAVQSARGQVEGAKAAIETAKVAVESARAQVESARGQVESSGAQIQSAMGQVESANASVTSSNSQIESAHAGVISAESGLESARAVVESAKSGVEGALAGIQSAQAAMASTEKDIERLDISAPFAGILETDTAELGALLMPGGLCATVIQLDPIKLVGFVPETEVARVFPGATAGARLSSGQDVVGQVRFISRSADENTRTFRVEVEVANTDLSIRDGQTVEIAIQSEGRSAHLLPQSALTLDNGGNIGVRVVQDGAAVFMPVAVLRDTTEGIWVSGLADVATVIVVGQEYVTDGVKVAATLRSAQE